MTAIDQHQLNQLLAKWAGVVIADRLDSEARPYWVYWPKFPDGTESPHTWDPLTDANQMELVKAGLREKGYGYEITWFASKRIHRALVWKLQNGGTAWKEGWDKSEAMALTLALARAIQALEE